MSFSEEDVENTVKNILLQSSNGLTFEELRNQLESKGIYVDGLWLRRIVSNMVRVGVVCKKISPNKRKFILKLCR